METVQTSIGRRGAKTTLLVRAGEVSRGLGEPSGHARMHANGHSRWNQVFANGPPPPSEPIKPDNLQPIMFAIEVAQRLLLIFSKVLQQADDDKACHLVEFWKMRLCRRQALHEPTILGDLGDRLGDGCSHLVGGGDQWFSGSLDFDYHVAVIKTPSNKVRDLRAVKTRPRPN